MVRDAFCIFRICGDLFTNLCGGKSRFFVTTHLRANVGNKVRSEIAMFKVGHHKSLFVLNFVSFDVSLQRLKLYYGKFGFPLRRHVHYVRCCGR